MHSVKRIDLAEGWRETLHYKKLYIQLKELALWKDPPIFHGSIHYFFLFLWSFSIAIWPCLPEANHLNAWPNFSVKFASFYPDTLGDEHTYPVELVVFHRLGSRKSHVLVVPGRKNVTIFSRRPA